MPVYALLQEALDLAQRMLPKVASQHRSALREEIEALAERQKELPAAPVGGAANYWKAYRESQEFRVVADDEHIDEVVKGLEAVSKQFGIEYKRLKRKIDLTRGNCTIVGWPPSTSGQRKPITLTIIRLPR